MVCLLRKTWREESECVTNGLNAPTVPCSNEPDPPIVVRIPRRVANIETVPDDMANSPRRVGTPVTPPF